MAGAVVAMVGAVSDEGGTTFGWAGTIPNGPLAMAGVRSVWPAAGWAGAAGTCAVSGRVVRHRVRAMADSADITFGRPEAVPDGPVAVNGVCAAGPCVGRTVAVGGWAMSGVVWALSTVA